MGGYGHISKMVRENRVKTNQRKNRLESYKKKTTFLNDTETAFDFIEVSEEKLKAIKLKNKNRIKKEQQKNSIKNAVILLCSIVITLGVIMFIIS